MDLLEDLKNSLLNFSLIIIYTIHKLLVFIKNHMNYLNGDRNKTLSVEEYLHKIRPYLKEIANNLKKSDTWKIQLTISNNFISFIDNDAECVMHSKSDNIENMINDEAYEVIK